VLHLTKPTPRLLPPSHCIVTQSYCERQPSASSIYTRRKSPCRTSRGAAPVRPDNIINSSGSTICSGVVGRSGCVNATGWSWSRSRSVGIRPSTRQQGWGPRDNGPRPRGQSLTTKISVIGLEKAWLWPWPRRCCP